MQKISARTINLVAALICVALLIGAYVLQHFYNVMPCPLCLLQRFFYYGLLIIFLLAGIHNPGSKGVRVYAVLSLLIALIGIGLSGRQVYLQLLPAGTTETCLPGLSYMLKTMPLSKVILTTLKGSAECASVDWRMFGITLAGWSFIWFLVFGAVSLWLLIKPNCSTANS